MTDECRRPDPSPISDDAADASQAYRPPTDGQAKPETMEDTSSEEKDAPDNATADHDDHDSHSLVEFALRQADTSVEETCAWCDFETVEVGIVKNRLHTLWLCDECATDIDMFSLYYGGEL